MQYISFLCRSETPLSFKKEKMYVADGSEMQTAASKCAKSKRTSKVKFFYEVLLLTPIMLIVIGLFCLPTVFYVLNPSVAEVNAVVLVCLTLWLIYR